MNQILVRYGIHNNQSDLQIHVCARAKKVYVFTPDHARSALREKEFRVGQARTGAIITGKGQLVPPNAITGCKRYDIPDDILLSENIQQMDPPGLKGRKAEAIARKMIARGIISLVLSTVTVTDVEMQRTGADLMTVNAQNYEVKCDFSGGETQFGGTGNLFIQEYECNPLGIH